jgi:hypothetical protein
VDSKTPSAVPLRSRRSRAHAELFARSNLPALRDVPVRVAWLDLEGVAAAERDEREGEENAGLQASDCSLDSAG